MKVKEIKISDKLDGAVGVKLQDILEEIPNGNQLHWAILYLYSMGDLSDGKSILDLEEEINKSQQSYILTWEGLNELTAKFDQVFGIQVMGCKDMKLLVRSDDAEEMYQNSEIFIELIDSAFWEVYSKNEDLIERLTVKFKKVKQLESDFRNQ